MGVLKPVGVVGRASWWSYLLQAMLQLNATVAWPLQYGFGTLCRSPSLCCMGRAVAEQLGKEMGWPSPVLMETSWRKLMQCWVRDGMKREMLVGLDAHSLSRLKEGQRWPPQSSFPGCDRDVGVPVSRRVQFLPSYTTEDIGRSSPTLSPPRAKTML